MDLTTFLDLVATGETIPGGSEAHEVMHAQAQEALRTVAELNGSYHEPDEVLALLDRLTGRPVPRSVRVFPPLYSEFGKNLRLGEDVFINSGCTFQDTGGITIGDRTLIGHSCTFATIDHSPDPQRRADMTPRPIVVGSDVWFGAGVIVVPGVTIGDAAIVGAGAVVTKDVAAGTVVAGVPARVLNR